MPVEPPAPVEARFTVELVTAAGERTPVPLVGPLAGSEQEGGRWDHRTEGTMVQLIDACDLSDTFWLWAGTRTDEPLALVDPRQAEPLEGALLAAGHTPKLA